MLGTYDPLLWSLCSATNFQRLCLILLPGVGRERPPHTTGTHQSGLPHQVASPARTARNQHTTSADAAPCCLRSVHHPPRQHHAGPQSCQQYSGQSRNHVQRCQGPWGTDATYQWIRGWGRWWYREQIKLFCTQCACVGRTWRRSRGISRRWGWLGCWQLCFVGRLRHGFDGYYVFSGNGGRWWSAIT